MQFATTEQLIAIAQSSEDAEAFNEIFRRHRKQLSAFLISAGIEFQAIDDVIQETYLKVFKNIHLFQGNSAFSTWLYRIAYNEMLMQTRKQSVFDKIQYAFSNHAPDNESSDGVWLLEKLKVLELLTQHQKDAFISCKVFGYTHTEAAERLKLPLGSLKTYLAQAQKIIDFQEKDG